MTPVMEKVKIKLGLRKWTADDLAQAIGVEKTTVQTAIFRLR